MKLLYLIYFSCIILNSLENDKEVKIEDLNDEKITENLNNEVNNTKEDQKEEEIKKDEVKEDKPKIDPESDKKIKEMMSITMCFYVISFNMNQNYQNIKKISESKPKLFRTQTQYEKFIEFLKIDLIKHCQANLKGDPTEVMKILSTKDKDTLAKNLKEVADFSYEKYESYESFTIKEEDKEFHLKIQEMNKLMEKSKSDYENKKRKEHEERKKKNTSSSSTNNNTYKKTNSNSKKKNQSTKKSKLELFKYIIIFVIIFAVILISMKKLLKEEKKPEVVNKKKVKKNQ